MDDLAFERPAHPRAFRLALLSLLTTLLIACGSTSPPPDGGDDGGITSPTSGPIELETNGSDAREQARFTLENMADRSLSWELRVVWNPGADNPQSGSWFDYSPARGTIPAGGSTELTLTLDEGLAEGTYTADLFVDYPGGSTPFVVTGQVGDGSGGGGGDPGDDPGFDLTLEQSALTLAPGENVVVDLTLTRDADFNESLSVEVESAPDGFGDDRVDGDDRGYVAVEEAGAPDDDLLALRVAPAADSLSGTITVAATSGSGAVRRATLELTVEGDAPAGSGTIRGSVTTVNADVPVDPPLVVEAAPTALRAPSSARSEPEYVPGQLLVAYDGVAATPVLLRTEDGERLESPAEARARGAAELRAAYGLELVRARGADRADLVRVPEGRDPLELAAELARDPRVRWAEPNWLVELYGAPSDPRADELWQLPVAGLPLAWEARRGSGDVVVAVLDSGIDFDHPDLQGAFVSDGYDFCDAFDSGSGTCSTDGNVTPNSSGDRHGTHVTGLVAARGDNGRGVAGAVPGTVRVLPVKVFEAFGVSAPVATIADALRWATGETVDGVSNPNPADIVNLSLGLNQNSAVLREAVEAAQGRGALLIAAAGNSSPSLDTIDTLAYPARYAGVISVGSVNSSLQRSCFSRYPGDGTGRDRHVMLAGGDEAELDGGSSGEECPGRPSEAVLSTVPGGYGALQGTSQAAPVAAGIAALVWAEQGSGATAASVRSALLDAAWRPDGADRDEFGEGILRADVALGFPGPGAEVSVALSGAETDVDVVRLDAFGGSASFSFSGLPAGEYTLEASADGLDATRKIDLDVDESRTANLRLSP